MTFKYEEVYLNEVATVVGPYEKKGPLANLYDKAYDDLYFGTKTWEQAECKLLEESVEIILNKLKKVKADINLHLSGDLLNQVVSTNYSAARIGIPLVGLYSACATSAESLILGANMIEARQIKNCLCSTSSHNNSAEKQFRYPVEYGGPKPKTATFTVTSGATAYLSRVKKGIKIESGTIGAVTEMGIKNPFQMGAIMAPSAGDTIYKHLTDLKREANYYDLILTGDLGLYGKQILKDYMQTEYGIALNNLDDSALKIYDIYNQPVYSGGSGTACLPTVVYTDILRKMKNKELKRVLIVATGALLSTTMAYQKLPIPSVSHAVSLEAI